MLLNLNDGEVFKMLHQRLLHSEKLAVTGRLGASIAHEINNPLQAAYMFLAHVMNNLEEGSEDKENLKLVKEALDRIAKIVSQLLNFHHPETSFTEFADINSIISKALFLRKTQLHQKKIKVIKRLSRRLPKINICSHQITQVLVNLILNAEDAMPGGGELQIRTKMDDGSVCIDVRDNGQGIPEENLDHIFEPFFTTRKGTGRGLGLCIAYGIIKAHGGEISLESRKDEGTVCIIKLPTMEKRKDYIIIKAEHFRDNYNRALENKDGNQK
jgi:signal transduction histidine kinase